MQEKNLMQTNDDGAARNEECINALRIRWTKSDQNQLLLGHVKLNK